MPLYAFFDIFADSRVIWRNTR